MSTHPCAAAATLVVLLAGLPTNSSAQDATAEALPRTLDDRPDLQGVWHFNTTTPLQRPEALADKPRYTEEEYAALAARTAESQGWDTQPPEGSVGSYNQFWWDRGGPVADRRTSLIVDPPDGRLPTLTGRR